MKSQKRSSILPKVVLALLVFFGITAGFKFNPGSKKENSQFPLSLKFKLLQPLHASADEWGFVRQSATWARGNSLFMDDIIAGIQSNTLLVLLASGNTVTATNLSLGDGGGVFDVRLTLANSGNEFQPSSSVYTTTKTFSNYLELKVAGTSNIALQFYWDDNPRLAGGDGALLIYNLARIAPSEWTAQATIESYVYMPDAVNDSTYSSLYPNQGLIQTYSWAGPLGTDSELGLHAQRGRVILEEMDNRTVFCFKTVVRLDGTANLFPLTAFANKALCQPGTSDEYYKLAYSQKLTGNLNVTAKSGWEEGAVTYPATPATDTLCGLTDLNFGLFDMNGFVRDGVDSSAVPSDYVPATRVTGLYGRIGSQGKSGSGDGHGVTWDDTSKSTIDGLNTVVTFKTPEENVGSVIPVN
ncbi:hypothetical protein EHQ81_00885 [Leptospira selangorensis]|uniref:Uncharacterized protein n=1 Tax=Leptospira selangorensis TaxID=2484982 RepID=A0A5F2C2E1_9LEPT|nr:hypothetical protein [Leptospira selangorensis]TGM17096.1 hypothetical protein EHQ81_00885 [Leptospira selangorensis]TGM21434.1 hypothetical protein EHQ82_10630 [Leptospira selangorensis]